ncbi:T9SS type A sorting domain-containing protein [candidate division KSB1 bacterium]|nr:T9SS type A sorting domain-containing protein [candidate division KSB1 bacterium]
MGHKILSCCIFMLALFLVVIAFKNTQAQSSTNYQVTKSVINQGGGMGESAHYQALDAIGQPADNGEMSSPNYSCSPGFLAGSIAMSSMHLELGRGWNMISFNVAPLDPNVEVVMSPILDQLVLMKNGGGQTFIPQYGINTIGEIRLHEGYQVYLNDNAPLMITGEAVPPDMPIELPTGWSLISYLPKIPIVAEEALESIIAHLVIAKNNAGQAFIPQYGINQIGEMLPGQGYQVYLNDAAILFYPAWGGAKLAATAGKTKAKSANAEKGLQPAHFRFTARTGENATVVLPAALEPQYPAIHRGNGFAMETGDEIGVFSSKGTCCGAVVWQQRNTALTIWGDDVRSDSLDGCRSGESVYLRVWHKRENLEYRVQLSIQKDHPAVYQANGFSVATQFTIEPLTGATDIAAAIPADFRLLQNYPNPFNPETTIEYHLPRPAEVILTIYDLNGHQVRQLVHTAKSAGYHSAHWNGRNDADQLVASGIYFYRIELHEKAADTPPMVDVKKMILMK